MPEGGFDPEDWKTLLFPSSPELNHRLAEGNLEGLSFTGIPYRKNTVHEASHAYFEDAYNLWSRMQDLKDQGVFNLITEDFMEWATSAFTEYLLEKPGLEEDLHSFINGETTFNEVTGFNTKFFERNFEMIREEFGKETSANYAEYIALKGIDEAVARVSAEKYLCNDIFDLALESIYNPYTDVYYTSKQGDVSRVNVQELGAAMEQDYSEVLQLGPEELVERFYDFSFQH